MDFLKKFWGGGINVMVERLENQRKDMGRGQALLPQGSSFYACAVLAYEIRGLKIALLKAIKPSNW